MTELAFRLKPGDVFFAPPIEKFVTLEEILDEGMGGVLIIKTSDGIFSSDPYESIQIKKRKP